MAAAAVTIIVILRMDTVLEVMGAVSRSLLYCLFYLSLLEHAGAFNETVSPRTGGLFYFSKVCLDFSKKAFTCPIQYAILCIHNIVEGASE